MDKLDPNSIADRLEAAQGDEAKRAVVAEVIATAHAMVDEDLLAAYQRTDGEPGNPEADALLSEIQRRELNF